MTGRLYHPAFNAEVRASDSYLPDDPDGQVAGTIALMKRYVLEDSAHPAVVRDMREALGTDNPVELSERERAERIWAYVKGRVSFAQDSGIANMAGLDNVPNAPVVEVLIRPRDLAVMCENGGCQRIGDCDDFSMYTAALLAAAGVKSSFVTVASDRAEPDRFSHVYVAAYPDGERLPLDASHGVYPGWETGDVTRMQEWPVSGASDVVGLLLGAAVVYWMAGR